MPIADYIDVDFELERPDNFVTGLNPETPSEMFGNMPAPRYAEVNRLIPRNEWQARAPEALERMRESIQYIHDQNGVGQCTTDAATGAMETQAFVSFGKEHFVKLSASSLYSRIGRSNMSGSSISDAAKYTQLEGVLPLEGEPYESTFKPVGYSPRQLPTHWKQTARLFKAQWQAVNSVEELVSALLQHKPCVVGRAGHAIYYIGIMFESGRMIFCYVNSWSLSWGDPVNDRLAGGLGYDTERKAARTGYACENVTVRSEIELPGQ